MDGFLVVIVYTLRATDIYEDKRCLRKEDNRVYMAGEPYGQDHS